MRLTAALGAAAVLVGCGSGSHQSTSAPATTTRPASQAQSTSLLPRIPAGQVIASYSGTGNGKPRSLSEANTTVLEWSVGSPPIQIFVSRTFLLVRSTARTGRVRLLPGRYPGVQVVTKGHWTIRLRAIR